MAGVELMEQITPDQIEAMSGGDHLKTEVRNINYFFSYLQVLIIILIILGRLLQPD